MMAGGQLLIIEVGRNLLIITAIKVTDNVSESKALG